MSNPRSEQRRTGDQLAQELAPQETLKRIITEDTTESIQALTVTAEQIGRRLARDVTTSQIRNIFGTVRAIEQDVKTIDDDKPLPLAVQRELQMLRPRACYVLSSITVMNRFSMSIAKARKCNPAKVSGNRS